MARFTPNQTGAAVLVENNIFSGNLSNASAAGISFSNGIYSYTAKASNNVIYNFIGGGIVDNGYVVAGGYHSNTIVGPSNMIGIDGAGANLSIRNNLISGPSNCINKAGFAENTCSTAVTFTNPTLNDYHLASSDSVARGQGINLIADSVLPVTRTIDGEMRGAINHFGAAGVRSETTADLCTVPAAGKTAFSGAASLQSFTVPSGKYAVTVKAWGAGGDGSYVFNGSYYYSAGGAGAFAQTTLSVLPGDAFTIQVGSHSGIRNGGIGFSGAGELQANGADSSFVKRNSDSVYVLEAGGGGGGYAAIVGAIPGEAGRGYLSCSLPGNQRGFSPADILWQYAGSGGGYCGGGSPGAKGGSSYAANGGVVIEGTGTTPPKTGDADRAAFSSTAGNGGAAVNPLDPAPANAGGDGLVVVCY
jgi:hypothetical protein